MKVLTRDADASIMPLTDKTVAVLGYGNQGHAHALNLRDSSVRVIVGARPDSRGARRARDDGFSPLPIAEAAREGELIILALPDELHAQVYDESIEPHAREGATLGFLHGFSIRFRRVKPRADLGVVMVAPKGPGTLLRERYVEGRGLPCLFAVHQDSPRGDAEALGLAWANAIGCLRAAIVCTSFAHETETDLFGEQAVLCGGLSQLIVAAFETLVEAGYPPELAYMECCQEVKQIADLIYDRGLAGMREAISNTAEFGAYRAGSRVIDDHVRARMRDLLREIQSSAFADAMRDDHRASFAWFREQRARAAKHPIEPPGRNVRAWMPWLERKT